jgi:hypothetical protein
MTMFSNPAASIPSLEAAVRHNTCAPATPGLDSTSLKLAFHLTKALHNTFVAMRQLESDSQWPSPADCANLLPYSTDSSKSPALLSLLLSCLKQLQHSSQHNPQAALTMGALASLCSNLAAQLFTLCIDADVSSSAGMQAGLHVSSNSGASPASSMLRSTPIRSSRM